MGATNIDRIIPGSNVDIVLDILDEDSNLLDTDGTPVITIYDPNGTVVVNAASMTKEQVGRFVYNFQTATADIQGIYKAVMSADVDTSAGSRTETKVVRFEVGDQ